MVVSALCVGDVVVSAETREVVCIGGEARENDRVGGCCPFAAVVVVVRQAFS